MSVKSLRLDSFFKRAVLLAAGLLFFVFIFLTIKGFLGNAVSTRAEVKEVAEMAVNMAPYDPQPRYALAVIYEQTFEPENFQKALAEYEKAVALSPYYFSLWLELGKARERNGDADGAELALRKALELAPNYAEVRWTLGNVLLRKGETDEAFAKIRQAVEGEANYTNPAVATAWQIFDGDLEQIKQNVGDSPRIRSALAIFLVRQNRANDAFEIWRALPAEEKKTTFKSNGEELFNQMLEAKKFRHALQVWSEITEEKDKEFLPGKITNGSFETNVKTEKANIFEWRIAEGAQPQIGVDDEQKHQGNRSLVIIFNSPNGADFRQISQTVTVEPGQSYIFETFYKTDLEPSTTLRWEIVDAADGKVLASTDAISDKVDWTNLKTEFTASENTEAVMIRLARENCPSSAVCPIRGKVWFDDFNLNPLQ